METTPTAPPPSRPDAFVTGGVYALLLLLGLLEGVVGSFQYSRTPVGSVPLGAVGFALLILVTCGLAGWAMRGAAAALVAAIGWFVASFWLAMPDSAGSVIISNTTAGEWYLYGGSVGALLGLGTALTHTMRRPPPAAGSGSPRPGLPAAGRPGRD